MSTPQRTIDLDRTALALLPDDVVEFLGDHARVFVELVDERLGS